MWNFKPASVPAVRLLAISQAGSALAAGMSNGTIHVCPSSDLTHCRLLHANGSLNDLRFSESGELAIADKNIRLLKSPTDPPDFIRADASNYGTVRFEPGRRRILTIDGKGRVSAIGMDTGEALTVFCCGTIWGEVDFVDGAGQAVSAGHWPAIWDVSGSRLLGRLTAQREEMTFGPIALDLEHRWLYMGSQDGRVYRWNIDSRKLLAKSNPLSGYVMSVSLLGASGWVAYASRPGVIHLWHPQTNIHRIVKGARASSNIVFDPKRGLAAFGTESGAIQFWDLLKARLVETRSLRP
jgi:WD40 repeat protein